MALRYFLKQFLLPPGGLLLLLLLAWWLRLRAPRLSAACFALGVGGLWVMAMPLTVEWAARALEREPALAQQHWSTLGERAQVIVVLGAGRELADAAWDSDQPSHLALERIRFAARLAKAANLPILASGGLHFGRTPPSEAQLAAEAFRRDFGIARIEKEEQSRTTWENAVYSAALLKAAGIERIVLVTSAAHMPRARWCFEANGLQVVAAPVGFLGVPNGRPLGGWLPEAKAVWQSGQLLNEAVGQLVYPLLYR